LARLVERSSTRILGLTPILLGVLVLCPLVESAAPITAHASRDPRDFLPSVIRRLGQYVESFGERASLLVCVETYVQRYNLAAVEQASERRLVSEFAIVRTLDATGWIGFRDVVEVDGRSITNQRDRLEALFRGGAPDLERARAIVNESARFNIGPIVRTLNIPTVALFFFVPRNLDRFTFSHTGATVVERIPVWKIAFRERETPSLIRRVNGWGSAIAW
jgi:hypothetical protein